MCGRVYQRYNVNQLLRLAGTNLINNQNRHQASCNIAPTTYIPAIKHNSAPENNHREVDMAKWGYNAPFGQFIINARIEDCQDKKTFKNLVNTKRCVLIIEGYFEWTPNHEPYVFRAKSSGDAEKDKDLPPCLYIAGLMAPDDTVMILTKQALREFIHVHERMPVVLDESEIDMWLDCENYKFEKIVYSEILNEKKEKWSKIYHYEIGPTVNNLKNKTDKCLATLEEYKKELDKNGIKRFFQPTKKKEEPPKQEKLEQAKPNEVGETPKGFDLVEEPTQPTQASLSHDFQEEAKVPEKKTLQDDSMIEEFEENKESLIKTDAELAQEHASKSDMQIETSGTKMGLDVEVVQKAINQVGVGGDLGFKATNAFVVFNTAGQDEPKATRGRKRKEPADGAKLVSENTKQSKKR